MPISIIDNLLRSGGMLEVLGGLRSKHYDVYLEDLSLGRLRLEGVPANLGWFEEGSFRLELTASRQAQLLAACTICAKHKGQEVAQLQAEWSRLAGEITTIQGNRFDLATAAKSRQETTVILKPDQKLLAISGGGLVGMRPVRVAPNQLDRIEFQAVLALCLFHLISLENAFDAFG